MSKSKVTGAWSGKSPHKPGPRFHRHAKLSDVRRAQRRGELTFAEWRQQQRKNLDNNLDRASGQFDPSMLRVRSDDEAC